MANKKHIPYSGLAPIGGLNVKDAINNMPGTDAIELVNWIPQQYGVRSRKGYREWVTGLEKPVQTILTYAPPRQSVAGQVLFAVTDDGVFDVTVSTDTPDPAGLVFSGANDAGRVSSIMLANSAGTFLVVAQQIGGYHYFNGTSWVTPVAGTDPDEVNGVDPTLFGFIGSWKRRIWAIEKNTAKAWYSPVDSLTGTFAKFDFGPMMKKGGALAFVANWTIDAGEGVDDLLVVGTENGEMIIYKGTDPASSSTFSHVGTYYVGVLPVGQRCFTTYGGDLLVLAQSGLQPISYVTRGGQSLLRASSTDYISKVQPLFSDLLRGLGNQTGWELVLNLDESLLIVQKPLGGVNVYEQYVMYTGTNAWCKLVGIPMTTSAATQLGYFFGTLDGRVCKGFEGYFDNVKLDETTGASIIGSICPAFSYFGAPGVNKQFHMVRPTFKSRTKPGCFTRVLVDFEPPPYLGSPNPSYVFTDGWDVSKWDQNIWGGRDLIFNEWYSGEGVGYAGAVYMKTASIGDTSLVSIDYLAEVGGPL